MLLGTIYPEVKDQRGKAEWRLEAKARWLAKVQQKEQTSSHTTDGAYSPCLMPCRTFYLQADTGAMTLWAWVRKTGRFSLHLEKKKGGLAVKVPSQLLVCSGAVFILLQTEWSISIRDVYGAFLKWRHNFPNCFPTGIITKPINEHRIPQPRKQQDKQGRTSE